MPLLYSCAFEYFLFRFELSDLFLSPRSIGMHTLCMNNQPGRYFQGAFLGMNGFAFFAHLN